MSASSSSFLSIEGLAPYDIGLPEQFDEFREAQQDAIEWIVNSTKRTRGAALPTGSGKTAIAIAVAKILGVRTAILTGTKGLMDQYLREFDRMVFPIKGKGNYSCVDKPTTCRMGEHEGCRVAGPGKLGCHYESERMQAKNSKIVLTNYAYWIRINERTRGLEYSEKDGEPNPFQLLILDEAHHAAEELSKALQVTVVETTLRAAKIDRIPKTDDVNELAEWAREAWVVATNKLAEESLKLKMYPNTEQRNKVSELDGLVEGLSKIVGMNSEYWVCELRQGTQWGRIWTFDCVWPGGLGESRLLLGIPNVVALSATLKPASLKMIGVRSEEMEFREWPRVFPAQNTRVYVHVSKSKTRKDKDGRPAPIGLNYRTSQEDWDEVIKDVDEFIGKWKGVRGLIHTGSYERQRMLMQRSKWRDVMIGNTQDPESATAAKVAEEWVERNRNGDWRVLVSPSFSTGWDFPGGGWVVFLKVPLRPSTGKVVQARLKKMPNYLDYQAMQDLVQGVGRLTRKKEDKTVVLIKDFNIFWFLSRNRNLKPGYFNVTEVERIPGPTK